MDIIVWIFAVHSNIKNLTDVRFLSYNTYLFRNSVSLYGKTMLIGLSNVAIKFLEIVIVRSRLLSLRNLVSSSV